MNASDSTPLVPDLATYAQRFEDAKQAVHELVSDLDHDDFNWRPGKDDWSVAECLDHLVVIGNLILPNIDKGIEKGRIRGWLSDGPYRYGPIGNFFVRLVGPNGYPPKRRFKTPPIFTPTSNHSVSRLQTAFVDTQDKFLERLRHADGLDLGRIRVPSSANRLVRFGLGQWFALLAGHQERHFLQAR